MAYAYGLMPMYGITASIGTSKASGGEWTYAPFGDGIDNLAEALNEIVQQYFFLTDKGFAKNEPVDVVIRPEDIKVVASDQSHLSGTVTNVVFKGVHYEIIVDIKNFKWLIQTTEFHGVGENIGIELAPDLIHVMKKSEYSGSFGDYSSYSEEYDELSEIVDEEEAAEELEREQAAEDL